MPVKIDDMPKPTCCSECRFFIEEENPRYCAAIADDDRKWTNIAYAEERPFWCPLKEVKE